MAAKSKSLRGIAGFGKLLVVSLRSRAAAFSLSRRCGHSSAYDKNEEETAHASAVPDEVIQPNSDRYWAPHPRTGVFGPTSDQGSAPSAVGQDSVLLKEEEEKAWFRPTSLEDLDKTHL